MRTMLIGLAAAAAVVAAAPAAHADHKGKVPWVTNAEEGMALARQRGLPTMIFFTASW